MSVAWCILLGSNGQGGTCGGPLCGLAGVYMINHKAEEGTRGRREEKPGAYIQDHASYMYFCFFS